MLALILLHFLNHFRDDDESAHIRRSAAAFLNTLDLRFVYFGTMVPLVLAKKFRKVFQAAQ